MHAGRHVELIIPNGTPIPVHRSYPDSGSIDCQNIVVTHYTDNADQILEDGMRYPPHEMDRAHIGPSGRFENTVRENAVYAWPFTAEYIDEKLCWDDQDPIFIEVPEDDVVVSSYRFLEHTSDADTDPYLILVEKYEQSLTFSVEQLRTAVQKPNRPCFPADLLI